MHNIVLAIAEVNQEINDIIQETAESRGRGDRERERERKRRTVKTSFKTTVRPSGNSKSAR